MSKLPPFTLVYESSAESSGSAGIAAQDQPGDPPPPGGAGYESADAPEQGDPPPPGEGGFESVEGPGDPPPPEDATGPTEASVHPHIEAVSSAAPELAESLKSLNLNPNLQRTLLATSFAQTAVGVDDKRVLETLKPIVADLQRDKNVVTIGLWDLDARAGQLPEVINLLNETQPLFTFFEVQGAPLPAALSSHYQRFVEWARQHLHSRKKRFTKAIREELEKQTNKESSNLISNDFYPSARVIHERIGVKYLVGITQKMIAGEDSDGFFWNYFSASYDKILIISTYALRDYAKRAGRPFEVALMMLVIAQLLVEMNSRLTFHEDSGCLFDFNADRSSVIESIRQLRIDDNCLSKINEKYREAALDMLKALRSYESGEAAEAATMEADVDYDYWLNQLDKMGEE